MTGCEIKVLESNFLIPTSKCEKALQSAREIVPILPTKSLAWVESKVISSSQSLSEALNAWGWTTQHRWNGVVLIDFQHQRWGDDELLLNILSKFASIESFVVMRVYDRMSNSEFQCRCSPSKRGIEMHFGQIFIKPMSVSKAVIQHRRICRRKFGV